jgi:hypothetical protein
MKRVEERAKAAVKAVEETVRGDALIHASTHVQIHAKMETDTVKKGRI